MTRHIHNYIYMQLDMSTDKLIGTVFFAIRLTNLCIQTKSEPK